MESKVTPFRRIREERKHKDDQIHKENKIRYSWFEQWYTPPFKYQNPLVDAVELSFQEKTKTLKKVIKFWKDATKTIKRKYILVIDIQNEKEEVFNFFIKLSKKGFCFFNLNTWLLFLFLVKQSTRV